MSWSKRGVVAALALGVCAIAATQLTPSQTEAGVEGGLLRSAGEKEPGMIFSQAKGRSGPPIAEPAMVVGLGLAGVVLLRRRRPI